MSLPKKKPKKPKESKSKGKRKKKEVRHTGGVAWLGVVSRGRAWWGRVGLDLELHRMKMPCRYAPGMEIACSVS